MWKRKIGQMGIFAQAKVGRWEKIGSGLVYPRGEGEGEKEGKGSEQT
jgi:hypothetical protein